jgi:hypothetical protein
MKDGSGKWLPSRWEDLMQKALIALDSLEGGPRSWTFGGGTAFGDRIIDEDDGNPDALIEELTHVALQNTRRSAVLLNCEHPGQQRPDDAANRMHAEAVERIVIAEHTLQAGASPVAEDASANSDCKGADGSHETGSRVMATRPATAPEQMPTTVGLPFSGHSPGHCLCGSPRSREQGCLVNEIIEAFGQQRPLPAIRLLNEASHQFPLESRENHNSSTAISHSQSHERKWLSLNGMSVLPSIVLQKSQKAQRLISRQRAKRATIADQ